MADDPSNSVPRERVEAPGMFESQLWAHVARLRSDVFALAPAPRTVPILGQRRGDRCADQYDEPRHVDPEQKQGQDGERPVDDLVRWKMRDVETEPVLGD